ncbi:MULTISPECIES: S-layer homology domain-containing protein [unclassified Sporosarcina]|uniref:S-layer homology domain-containing protein n=1 Tax=unclassified Sporosarcina TaxID=2647733 RepID=UPI00130451D7|nr:MULTISPECIES: S-layer homology domain-containing protein [unclassified Sporosarcina]
MKKLFLTFGTVALALSLPLSSMAASNQKFTDVPETKHFAEAVNELAERHIITGYPDGMFKPGNPITRGQVAAIIVKLLKENPDYFVKEPGFKDVSKANGYYNSIAKLAELEIMGGYADGSFGPNDPVTRGQMASILVKAYDLPRFDFIAKENPFRDVKSTNSHGANVLNLYKLGITTGVTPERFGINEFVTRGQASKLMLITERVHPETYSIKTQGENSGTMLRFSEIMTDEDTDEFIPNSEIYHAAIIKGRQTSAGYTGDRLQLTPLKEGRGTIQIGGNYGMEAQNIKRYYHKYYVDVKKVDGKLKIQLQYPSEILKTRARLKLAAGEKVENVRLVHTDGEVLSDKMPFERYTDSPDVFIRVNKTGNFIATVRLTDGKEVRYTVDVKAPTTHMLYYEVKITKMNDSK